MKEKMNKNALKKQKRGKMKRRRRRKIISFIVYMNSIEDELTPPLFQMY